MSGETIVMEIPLRLVARVQAVLAGIKPPGRASRFSPAQIAGMNRLRWELGRSIGTIARLYKCSNSTVGYWTSEGVRELRLGR